MKTSYFFAALSFALAVSAAPHSSANQVREFSGSSGSNKGGSFGGGKGGSFGGKGGNNSNSTTTDGSQNAGGVSAKSTDLQRFKYI
jgi:hypothetical protein